MQQERVLPASCRRIKRHGFGAGYGAVKSGRRSIAAHA